MEDRRSLDAIDQSILRILSAYGGMPPLDLWYELGEDDTVKERITEGEIRTRLESLRKKGFVERATRAEDSVPLIYRVKSSTDMEGHGEEGPGPD